jgi:hypothetical protein
MTLNIGSIAQGCTEHVHGIVPEVGIRSRITKKGAIRPVMFVSSSTSFLVVHCFSGQCSSKKAPQPTGFSIAAPINKASLFPVLPLLLHHFLFLHRRYRPTTNGSTSIQWL